MPGGCVEFGRRAARRKAGSPGRSQPGAPRARGSPFIALPARPAGRSEGAKDSLRLPRSGAPAGRVLDALRPRRRRSAMAMKGVMCGAEAPARFLLPSGVEGGRIATDRRVGGGAARMRGLTASGSSPEQPASGQSPLNRLAPRATFSPVGKGNSVRHPIPPPPLEPQPALVPQHLQLLAHLLADVAVGAEARGEVGFAGVELRQGEVGPAGGGVPSPLAGEGGRAERGRMRGRAARQ